MSLPGHTSVLECNFDSQGRSRGVKMSSRRWFYGIASREPAAAGGEPEIKSCPAESKDERGNPLEARQDGRCGIEQYPVPEIAVRMSNDHGAGWSRDRKHSEQPAILLELTAQDFGHDLGRTVEDDHVIRCAGGIAGGCLGGLERDIRKPKAGENLRPFAA